MPASGMRPVRPLAARPGRRAQHSGRWRARTACGRDRAVVGGTVAGAGSGERGPRASSPPARSRRAPARRRLTRRPARPRPMATRAAAKRAGGRTALRWLRPLRPLCKRSPCRRRRRPRQTKRSRSRRCSASWAWCRLPPTRRRGLRRPPRQSRLAPPAGWRPATLTPCCLSWRAACACRRLTCRTTRWLRPKCDTSWTTKTRARTCSLRRRRAEPLPCVLPAACGLRPAWQRCVASRHAARARTTAADASPPRVNQRRHPPAHQPRRRRRRRLMRPPRPTAAAITRHRRKTLFLACQRSLAPALGASAAWAQNRRSLEARP